MARGAVKPDQHFTQPPPRYSEASLVKRLEELGIGRPSTYASIIQVLQDRDYVRIDKKRFVPEDRGRLVTAFLTSFFERLVEYNFTADLENQLDDISGGRTDWKKVLRDFWQQFSTAIDGTKELTITQVIAALDEDLGRHFFPDDGSGKDPRLCPSCSAGRLSLKLGKFGAFIGCSNYPNAATRGRSASRTATARPRRPMPGRASSASIPRAASRSACARDPTAPTSSSARARTATSPSASRCRAASSRAEVDLEMALRLLALPRDIGKHPETGETITAGIGRFGPYIKHGSTYKSLTADDDVLTIGLNRAVSLLAEPSKGRRGAPTPLRVARRASDGRRAGRAVQGPLRPLCQP